MTTTRDLLEQLNEAIHDAEIAGHIPHALVVAVHEHLQPCSPGCPGWAHFNVGGDREGIERCDECSRFASDSDAANAHRLHCSCGMEVGEIAVQCHQCKHSIDALVVSCTVNAEHRLVCPVCVSEASLDAGATRCRIGADWCVQTWVVDSERDLYICDSEDGEGTYELICRSVDAETDEYVYELVMSCTYVAALLAVGHNGCRVQFAVGATKGISNYEINLSGMTGTVVAGEYDRLEVRLDEHREDLDEWSNCVIWEQGEWADLLLFDMSYKGIG